MFGLSGIIALSPVGYGQSTSSALDQDALWAAIQAGGHIVLMRHALAPGTGDPANFQLDDCTTQRNLSAEGKEQARHTGEQFRARQIAIGRVLSSRWCRCLDTALLLNLAKVEPFPPLDSFFENPSRGPQQTEQTRALVGETFTGPSWILVTHQVNITALTGIFPQSGEMVVLRPQGQGQFIVLGRLQL